jgi:hypothetical protein
MKQTCGRMTEELDTVGAPKTGMPLRLVMVAIAIISLAPAVFAMVVVILGSILVSVGSGKDYLDAKSWLIVIAALLLAVSTCATAAVAAMSGDRRSTWIGIALFAAMILSAMVVHSTVAPDAWRKASPPLTIRTAQ